MLENKREMTNMDHIVDSNQMLWNIGLDIPVMEPHVGWQPLLRGSRIKRDIQPIQLHRRGKLIRQVRKPDSVLCMSVDLSRKRGDLSGPPSASANICDA